MNRFGKSFLFIGLFAGLLAAPLLLSVPGDETQVHSAWEGSVHWPATGLHAVGGQCSSDQSCMNACLGQACVRGEGVCKQCLPGDVAACKNATPCTNDYKCTCVSDGDCFNYQSCVQGVCQKKAECTKCYNGKCCPNGQCLIMPLQP